MDTDTKIEPLPVPWQDENGDYWWCKGDIEPHRFLLAVAVQEAACGTGNIEYTLIGTEGGGRVDFKAAMKWANDQLDSVKRIHCRPDPAHDDGWLFCGAGDDGAAPFTRLSVG